MNLFTRLYARLDSGGGPAEQSAALREYFSTAMPHDAAWALHLLLGRRPPCRRIPARLLRECAGAASGAANWLIDECRAAVGDLPETLALLAPDAAPCDSIALHRVVEEWLAPLDGADAVRRRELIMSAWRAFGAAERCVFNRLMCGGLRRAVTQTAVIRALAVAAGVDRHDLARRLNRGWSPTAADFLRLIAREEARAESNRPYLFKPARRGGDRLATLGAPACWAVEWKWRGPRTQCVRRGGETLLWSREGELLGTAFPEIAAAAERLPDGVVLDGAIVGLQRHRPTALALPLEPARGRPIAPGLFDEPTAAFMAFDLLELDGSDLRQEPWSRRRSALEALFATTRESPVVRISALLPARTWAEVERLRAISRSQGAAGLILKPRDGSYLDAGSRDCWIAVPAEPFRIDAVLLHVGAAGIDAGRGDRTSPGMACTFGLWSAGELVPIATLTANLPRGEARELNQFAHDHTLERRGPLRIVRPVQVFELAYEGVEPAPRRKARVVLREARLLQWKRRATAEDAAQLSVLREAHADTAG